MDLRSLLSQCYTDMTLPTPPPVLWDGGYPEEDIRPLKSKHFILQKKLLTWRKKRMGALLVAHTHTHTPTHPRCQITHTQSSDYTHTPYIHYTHTCPKGGFSSVQSLSRVRLFATPWTPACQASLSITNSQSSLRLTSIESVMPSSHLILCRPLLLLPPIPPSIRVFSNEAAYSWVLPFLHIQPLYTFLLANSIHLYLQ